jgi:hypothetical protein
MAIQNKSNHHQGTVGEIIALMKLRAAGFNVQHQVTITLPNGEKRRCDLLLTHDDGKQENIEIKTGGATRTPQQVANDALLLSEMKIKTRVWSFKNPPKHWFDKVAAIKSQPPQYVFDNVKSAAKITDKRSWHYRSTHQK